MRKASVAISLALSASLALSVPTVAWANDDQEAEAIEHLADAVETAGDQAQGGALGFDEKDGAGLLANGEAADLFIDTDAGQWYSIQGWLDYVVDNSLIKGYNDGPYAGYFGPNDPITRGQVATILWRMAGHPEADADAPGFVDLQTGAYYEDAVMWASGEGVVTGRMDNGVPTGVFDPEGNVTREELATMMGRYAAYVAGLDASESYASSTFNRMPDASSVSEFARGWMAWCFDSAILRGNDQTNTLNPKNSATRAEMSKMTTVLRRDVIELPESDTTQVERENALLALMQESFDDALGAFSAYGVSHKVHLLPASSGKQHSYWIDVTFPWSSFEIETMIAASDDFSASWAKLKASLAESSRTLYDASKAALVDLPVNICVLDKAGAVVLLARNGAITSAIA